MRAAYADPPYPGQAGRYAGGVEVNVPLLVEHLRTFEAYALSTSASALLDVWRLMPEARCAVWVKSNPPNGWSRVRWTWEPVLFVTPRRGLEPGGRSTVWDSLVSATAWRQGAGVGWREVDDRGGGAKPPAFSLWLFALLGLEAVDDLDDLFAGSGAVERAWHQYRADLGAIDVPTGTQLGLVLE